MSLFVLSKLPISTSTGRHQPPAGLHLNIIIIILMIIISINSSNHTSLRGTGFTPSFLLVAAVQIHPGCNVKGCKRLKMCGFYACLKLLSVP